MQHTTISLHGRAAILPALAATLLLTLASALPASAAATGSASATAPQLSITITDERESTRPADESTYTIRVENVGSIDARNLLVTQSVPAGMTFGSADSAGALKRGSVSWELDLPAASATSVSTTMTVGKTAPDLLRMATVACAQETKKEPPIVCASDSNLLPAGAAAAAAAEPSPASTVELPWVIGCSAALLATLVAVVAVFWRRSRRPGRADRLPTPARDDSA